MEQQNEQKHVQKNLQMGQQKKNSRQKNARKTSTNGTIRFLATNILCVDGLLTFGVSTKPSFILTKTSNKQSGISSW